MVDFLEPATVSFAVRVHRAAQPAGGADGRFILLGAAACPENTLGAPTPRNESVGGDATLWCITVNFGLDVVPKRAKWLTPALN